MLRSAGLRTVLRYCLWCDRAIVTSPAAAHSHVQPAEAGSSVHSLYLVRCGRVRDGLAPPQPREQAAGRGFLGAVAAAPLRLGHSREYLFDVHAAAPVSGLVAGPAGDAMAHVISFRGGQCPFQNTPGGGLAGRGGW